MPLRSTEVLLRKTGIRIGYDLLRESHALIIGAEKVSIDAKPLEDAGSAEAITVHASMPGYPQRYRLEDAIAITPYEESPEKLLDSIMKRVSAGSMLEAVVIDETIDTLVYYKPGSAHILIEPDYKYVGFTITPNVKRKAESIKLEARRPSLVNVMLERMQIVSIIYEEPVVIRVTDLAEVTRITIEPQRRQLAATGKN